MSLAVAVAVQMGGGGLCGCDRAPLPHPSELENYKKAPPFHPTSKLSKITKRPSLTAVFKIKKI